MIKQNEAGWARDDIPRAWIAHTPPAGGNPADPVLCRKYPEPGHEVDGDYPPTVELSADEWRRLTDGIDVTDQGWTDEGRGEISRRLDALVWPEGTSDGAKS